MFSSDRRAFVKGAGLVGTALLAPGLPVWSLAETRPRLAAPPEYAALASALLGVDAGWLNPEMSPDGVSPADIYFGVASSASAEGVKQLIASYDALVKTGQPSVLIANGLLTEGTRKLRTDQTGTFARMTMLMWLYGVWYGGTETTNNPAASAQLTGEYKNDFVVSGRSYKDGWIWRIAQAHAMGFSQFNFGSWSVAPPDLADYGISLT